MEKEVVYYIHRRPAGERWSLDIFRVKDGVLTVEKISMWTLRVPNYLDIRTLCTRNRIGTNYTFKELKISTRNIEVTC